MASIILDLVKCSVFFPGWNIQRVSSGSWGKNQNPACVWAGLPPFDSCSFLQTCLAPSPYTPSLGSEAVFTRAHHWWLISEGSSSVWQILLLPLDPICGRQSHEPQRCPGPNPNSMEPVNMGGYTADGELRLQTELRLLFTDLQIGRSSWIFWVGAVESEVGKGEADGS